MKIKKKGGVKALPNAFIGNKGRTVFERAGYGSGSSKSREAIRPVMVIDVPQMFSTKRIHSQVVAFVKSKFPEVFAREARYFTDRFSKGR